MRLARSAFLLALGACSSPGPEVAREAPDVHFEKAAVLAAVPSQRRREIEDIVATEIERRRPESLAVSTWEHFPDLAGVSEQRLVEHLKREDVDLLVTIVPFSVTPGETYDEVASKDLGTYVEGLTEQVMAGDFGVQVTAWDVATRQKVYTETSAALAGSLAGPREVIDFTVATVARDL